MLLMSALSNSPGLSRTLSIRLLAPEAAPHADQEPCFGQDCPKQVLPISASLSIAPKPGKIDPDF